jgi:tRNA dimethylallyltransferase
LRARLRHSAKRSGAEHLHRMLLRLDPGTAARIGERDTQKIIRALEMRFLAKKPVGEIHAQGRAPLEGFAPVKIGLHPPRAALYARIEKRVHEMFDAGWPAEVRELLHAGVPPEAKPFTFIGYREILARYSGELKRDPAELKLEETILEIQKATRQFAKRQLTWFRKEPNVHWLETFGDDPSADTQALALL